MRRKQKFPGASEGFRACAESRSFQGFRKVFAHAQRAEVSRSFFAHAQKSIQGSRAFWKNLQVVFSEVFSPFSCSVPLWLVLETFLIVLGMFPNSAFSYSYYYFFRISLTAEADWVNCHFNLVFHPQWGRDYRWAPVQMSILNFISLSTLSFKISSVRDTEEYFNQELTQRGLWKKNFEEVVNLA